MKAKLKDLFGRRFRAGSYSMLAVVMVLAIAVVVNLIVGAMPSSQTQLDMTGKNLLNLSEQTKRIVSSVNRDVDLYLIADKGSEDQTLTRLLDRYADLNSHVKWTAKDPTADPTFLSGYDLKISQLYENSVLVDCGGKFRLVGYDEIYVTDYDYDYYSYNYSTTTTFEGENALTNAIHYVAAEDLPKVYIISGHGEAELSTSVTDALAQDNFEYETLSLLTLDSIPEDAAALILYEPSTDLGEDEAQLLTDYLAGGGNLMLTTRYSEAGTLTNLMKVTESMGLTSGTGMIMEGDRNMRLSRYPYYLLPDMAETDETNALISGRYYVLVPMAHPITATENSPAEITWLLTTSSSAYAKQNVTQMTTTEKQDGDTEGPFNVGAVSVNNGRLVWIGGESFLSDNVNGAVSGANMNLYLNFLNGMGGQTESISIRGVAMDKTGLTVPSASSGFWSAVMIGIIPAILVLTGVIIMLRRKRK